MGMRLYVGNLPFSADEDQVRQLFSNNDRNRSCSSFAPYASASDFSMRVSSDGYALRSSPRDRLSALTYFLTSSVADRFRTGIRDKPQAAGRSSKRSVAGSVAFNKASLTASVFLPSKVVFRE